MKKHLLLLWAILCVSLCSKAYDLKSGSLYYKITSDTTVAVTYQRSESPDNYLGLTIADIPDSVTYNSKTYSVTSIDNFAFFWCSTLVSVNIGNNITCIGGAAFGECISLQNVNISSSVQRIEEGAFESCSSLEDISIPNGVTYIGGEAFTGTRWFDNQSKGLVYINSMLYAYKDTMPENTIINIPEGIKSICGSAFSDCSGLNSINIPNSVTSIGAAAFYNCSNLSSIAIPENLTTIENSTFSGCSALTSITIPNSVKSIKAYAFEHCSNLNSITIPNGIMSIGRYAFYGCSSLNSISIPKNITSIEDGTFSGCSSLNAITIPNTVTTIGYRAFYNCTNLYSVIIPNTVNSIGNEAFYNVFHITYDGTAIGASWGAKYMNKYFDGVLFYESEAKQNILRCISTATGDIVVPNTVTSISDEAFKDCSEIQSIQLPYYIETIGEGAFQGCTALETCMFIKEDMPSPSKKKHNEMPSETRDTVFFINTKNWTNIHVHAWGGNVEGTTWPGISAEKDTLQWNGYDVYFFVANAGDYAYCIFNNGGDGGQTADLVWTAGKYYYKTFWIEPNEHFTEIGAYAFDGCTALSTIDLPEQVKSIGNNAFQNCRNLVYIDIPDGVTRIEHNIFSNCSNLTSVNYSDGITSIGYEAFSGCTSLTSVTIPKLIKSMGFGLIEGCSSLSSIVWNAINYGGWEYASSSPFYNLRTNISSITFGDEVEVIPTYLCYEMEGITSVKIPRNVKTIQNNAFQLCSNITKKVCEGQVEQFGNFIVGKPVLDTVVISANAFDISESLWTSMPKNIHYIKITGGNLSDNVCNTISRNYKVLKTLDLAAATNTTLSDEAFSGCFNLQTLVLPSELTVIPYMAVAGCVNLQSITIPAAITDIEQRAFENCRSLFKVTFEEDIALEHIKNWAFYNCHNLQSITIPEGVTEIGNAAFYGCNYLQDLTLPSSLHKIGDNTFAFCSKLQKMQISALVPPIAESKTFLDVLRTIPVIVPDEAVEDYKAAAVWQEFYIVGESNDPMEIENTRNTNAQGVLKMIREGQMLITRNGVTYNMIGNIINIRE